MTDSYLPNKTIAGLILIASFAIAITGIVGYEYGFSDGVKSDMPVLIKAYDDINNNGCPDQVELDIAKRADQISENVTMIAVKVAKFVTADAYYNAYDKLIGCCDKQTFNMTCALKWNETYSDYVYPPRLSDD